MQTLRAVIWDYDGTLVDSRHKNIAVTAQILAEVTGKQTQHFQALSSMSAYESANRGAKNWRDLYQRFFGLSSDETERAGQLWDPYQQKNGTPVQAIEGMDQIFERLKDVPMGIVSQNGREQIGLALDNLGWRHHFPVIIGHGQVVRQKPDPQGLLHCIEQIVGPKPGHIIYIGDHETDMGCAYFANQYLQKNKRPQQVIGVGASYLPNALASDWELHSPDLEAKSVQELERFLTGSAFHNQLEA